MSKRAIICGFVLGLTLGAAGAGLGAWLVTGEGEASVQLASLEPLGVSPAKIEGAFPGQAFTVSADVDNPNPVPLALASSALSDLHSDETGCATGTEYIDRSADVVLQPGANEDVAIGRLVLPEALPNRCQAAVLRGQLVLSARFGT
jgi:hypothetical protein